MMIGAYWYTIASVTGLPWVVVVWSERAGEARRYYASN